MVTTWKKRMLFRRWSPTILLKMEFTKAVMTMIKLLHDKIIITQKFNDDEKKRSFYCTLILRGVGMLSPLRIMTCFLNSLFSRSSLSISLWYLCCRKTKLSCKDKYHSKFVETVIMIIRYQIKKQLSVRAYFRYKCLAFSVAKLH